MVNLAMASFRFNLDTCVQKITKLICTLKRDEEQTYINTVMRRLTTRIRSEKCVDRRFRRCANVTECTYTNLDSTI